MQWLQQGALLALFIWNFAHFSIALRSNFSRPDGVPVMMRVLAICGGLAALADIILLFTRSPSVWRSALGLVLLIISQLLFRAAVSATAQFNLSLAFSADTPERLNQSGPYRFIRHPFYAAYALTWLAIALATAHWVAIGAFLVMSSFYFTAARREENKFQRSPLADAYRAYQNNTGMFFPAPNLDRAGIKASK